MVHIKEYFFVITKFSKIIKYNACNRYFSVLSRGINHYKIIIIITMKNYFTQDNWLSWLSKLSSDYSNHQIVIKIIVKAMLKKNIFFLGEEKYIYIYT